MGISINSKQTITISKGTTPDCPNVIEYKTLQASTIIKSIIFDAINSSDKRYIIELNAVGKYTIFYYM